MIVTAALPWYDEAPEDLDRYVRALAGFCDRLVAVDGGYERYPGAKPCGPIDEAGTIRDAAHDVGMSVEIIRPTKVWRGQVQKRSYLYEIAAEGSDWVFTLDSDHILHGPTEPFRHELESVTEDAVAVPFYTTQNHDLPMAQTAATDWHAEYAGVMINHRLLLRALPGIRVEKFHWYVSALRGRERVWLQSVRADKSYKIVDEHVLEAPMLVEHRCHFRRERNILANREFCEDRIGIVNETGQEDVLDEVA